MKMFLRFCLEMKSNTSRRVNSLDIETIVRRGKFTAICLCYSYNGKIYSFYGKDCIDLFFIDIKTRLSKKMKHVFYIHNVNFDGLMILNTLSKMDFKVDILGFNSNIYYLRVFIDDTMIEFRCSYKLVPLSLKHIAKMWLNLEKLPFPYGMLLSEYDENSYMRAELFDNGEDRNKWLELDLPIITIKDYTIAYCSRDVELTSKFVEKFWAALSIFNLKKNLNYYSLPSISVNIFFRQFNKYEIDRRLNPVLDRFVRRGYFGGRCEVFGNPMSGEKIFHYDFQGMYSQCMSENFPYGSGQFIFEPNSIDKPGFYDVDWEISSDLPILPMRDEAKNKLMFYKGKGRGLYWHEELKLHLDNGGRINRIYSCLVYEKSAKVFENFVYKAGSIRSKGGLYKDIGKLMINSVYGRMGMGRENTRTIISRDETIIPKMHKFVRINNFIIGEIVEEREFEGISNVVMASIITSKARVKLYKAFTDVYKNGGRLLYSDTDSVIAAYKNDVSNETHGEVFWDTTKSDTIIKDACFALPKTYSVVLENGIEITKIKGIRRNHIKFDRFKKIFDVGGSVVVDDFFNIKRSDYDLGLSSVRKEVRLDNYKKRVWSSDRVNTYAFKA